LRNERIKSANASQELIGLREFHAKWTAEGKYVIDIGINTGGMVVGNRGDIP